MDIGRELEVGYHLHPDYRGRGLATEAARASLRHGFEHVDCERIVSIVHPENVASCLVAARVHARRDTVLRNGQRFDMFSTNRVDGSG